MGSKKCIGITVIGVLVVAAIGLGVYFGITA